MSKRSGLSQRDTRAALLGTGPSSSSSRSRGSSPLPLHNPREMQGYAANRTAEDLEGQNESHLEGLSAQVRMLKQITSNIGAEIKDSTKMLTGMNDSFSETGGFLGGTVKKMGKMARRQGGQWCYWMIFLIICAVIFFWTWVWRR